MAARQPTKPAAADRKPQVGNRDSGDRSDNWFDPVEAGLDDADPVAACVREIVAERTSWTGSGADLLRAGAGRSGSVTPRDGNRLAPKILARSLAACVASRRSCGHWASRLRSVAKAGPEAGSLGYAQLKKILLARSATIGAVPRQA
jgi:hypothetical protein